MKPRIFRPQQFFSVIVTVWDMVAPQFLLGLFFLGGVLSSFSILDQNLNNANISQTDDLLDLNQPTKELQSSSLISSTNKSTTETFPKTTPAPEPPSSNLCNATLFGVPGWGDPDQSFLYSFESNATGTTARWMAYEREWFCLELKGNLTASSYMALGFSQGGMGPAPVVACSPDSPQKFPLYWNSADNSAPAFNSTANVQTTVNTTGGTTTCYVAINSNFSVFPNSSSTRPEQFDLNFTPFHLVVATGPVKNGSLT